MTQSRSSSHSDSTNLTYQVSDIDEQQPLKFNESLRELFDQDLNSLKVDDEELFSKLKQSLNCIRIDY